VRVGVVGALGDRLLELGNRRSSVAALERVDAEVIVINGRVTASGETGDREQASKEEMTHRVDAVEWRRRRGGS
jgi:hypothetical protein